MLPNFNINIGGEKPTQNNEPAEDLLGIISDVEYAGAPRNHEEAELDWLISKQCADLLGNVNVEAHSIIERALKLHINEQLPHTLALFGGWGSGKTHLLTEIAKECHKRELKVVYFNAFKYAAFMEIVPSLVYRILRITQPDSGSHKLLYMANDLAKQHQPRLYRGLSDFTKLSKKGISFYKNTQSDRQLKKASEYFGRVDRFHETLNSELSSEMQPIFVLIDELDRCEPMEAFDIIKQLRILFCARNIPLYFVLAVNPDPIGRTIQAKYSLDKSEDYESLRILEKFVDSVQFITKNRTLSNFIESTWKASGLDILNGRNLIALAAKNANNFLLPADTEHLPIYSNLRLIEKTVSVLSYDKTDERHMWTRWHLLLIEAMFPNFREQLRKLSPFISKTLNEALGAIIGPKLGGAMKGRALTTFGVDTNSINRFYDEFLRQVHRHRDQKSSPLFDLEREEIIDELLKDSNKLRMLTQVCFIDLADQEITDVISTGEKKLSECLKEFQGQLQFFEDVLRMKS